MAAMYDSLHCQPFCFCLSRPPLQKLSTYESRETTGLTGLFYILKWIALKENDFSKKEWLAVHWRFLLGRSVAGSQGFLAHEKPLRPRTLQEAHAQGPMVILGKGAVVMSEVPL